MWENIGLTLMLLAVVANQIWWWRHANGLQGTIRSLKQAGRVTRALTPGEAREIAGMLSILYDQYQYEDPEEGPFLTNEAFPERVAHFRDLFLEHAREAP